MGSWYLSHDQPHHFYTKSVEPYSMFGKQRDFLFVFLRRCHEFTKRRSITSIYQPTNAHIISHKTLLKHFKTLRHVSILSDHHQGALFLAKVILRYSQFNSYLQTRCCGSISCCVGMCCGAVARCASYDAHLATAPQHNMICCHNTSFASTN